MPSKPRGLEYTLQALSPALQVLVDQTVLQRLVGCEEIVTVGVALDLLDRLARVLGEQAIEPFAQAQDVLGVDGDVGGLALETAQRLMNEDGRVGQREALALASRAEKECPHAG